MSAPQDPPPAEREGTTEAAPEQPTPTTSTGPDGLEAIRARMDEMATQQQQLVELFQPPEEEEGELDESTFYDDEGALTDDGARALIGELVAEQVTQQLAPREQAAAQRERDFAFDDLRSEYPELRDDKVAGEAINVALKWANEHAPSLIDTAAFVDLVEQAYVGSKYRERVSAEEPATQGRHVVLESASGAGSPEEQEVDWGDRILKAAERLRPDL